MVNRQEITFVITEYMQYKMKDSYQKSKTTKSQGEGYCSICGFYMKAKEFHVK